MKQIFPTSNNIISCCNANEKPISQQQYEDLVERTNRAEQEAADAERCVSEHIENLQNHVGTCSITANTANVGAIGVDGDLTVGGGATVACDLIVDRRVISDCTITCTITASDYLGDKVYVNQVNTTDVYSENALVDHLTAEHGLIGCATTCTLISGNTQLNGTTEVEGNVHLTNTNLTLDEDSSLNICGTYNVESFRANEFTAPEINTTNVDVNDTLNTKFITHTYCQTSVQINDKKYILLPIFTNGLYLLEGKNDTNSRKWSVEILNSINNIEFRWSEDQLGYLQDIKYGIDASGAAVVQIHIDQLGENIQVFYQSISTDNRDAPTWYDQDQLSSVSIEDEKSGILIKQLAGTYINNIIFTDKLHVKCLEMDALFMDCVGVYRKLFLSCDFNVSGDIVSPVSTSGTADQYVVNREICGFVTPTWESPATCVTTCVDNSDKLLPSGVAAQYNGCYKTVCVDPETEEVITECHYPITHLGNAACVHGSAQVGCNLSVCCSLNTPSINDSNLECNLTCGLTNVRNGELVNWSRACVVDDNQRLDELAVYNEDFQWQDTIDPDTGERILGADGHVIRYDAHSNSLFPSRSLELDDLSVNNLHVYENAQVDHNLTVDGDLYVKGVTHTVEEETVSTSSDMLVLRQNNPSALASGEVSGMLVNNALGNDRSVAVITDNTGTLRIGEPAGSRTGEWEILYYKSGHWYTDVEEENEVHPAGELISWSSKTFTENGSTKYVDPEFIEYNYAGLSPVLGRDETSNMRNNSLLIWNGTTWEANTIDQPVADTTLHYGEVEVAGEPVTKYYWKKDSGVYHFATMAAYQAAADDIPEDSMIIIDEIDDYTVSEDAE